MKMTLADALSEIKNTVTAADVCRRYGLEVSPSGFARCPWHNDTRPSLKIYPGSRGCHCFACGAGSSVIDLTMAIHAEPLRDAAQRLISDFGLDVQIDGNAGRGEYKPRPVDYKALYEAAIAARAEDLKDLQRLAEVATGSSFEAIQETIDSIETRLYNERHRTA